MEQPTLVAGLTRKRAEIAGAILTAEKHLIALREDLAHLDATLLLFNPDAKPTAIRPRVKRPPARFKAGGLAKVVLTILRDAGRPMNARELLERVAADHQIDISSPREAKKLDYSIRNALARKRPGVACKAPDGDVMTWAAG
jgi:hypothetical protein